MKSCHLEQCGGPGDSHIERSKMDKYGITYMWKLKHKNNNDTNEIIYKTEIEPQM